VSESETRGWSYLLLVVSAAVVVVLTVTAAAVFSSGVRSALGLASAKGYAVGDAFDVDLAPGPNHGRTLVILGRESCPACRRAHPFLKSLVEVASRQADIRVAMVVPEGVAEAEMAFATSLGVRPEQVTGADLASLRLAQVPTVVLLDATGRVSRVWGPDEIVNRPDDLMSSVAALTRKP
jgi:hypothetical protein